MERSYTKREIMNEINRIRLKAFRQDDQIKIVVQELDKQAQQDAAQIPMDSAFEETALTEADVMDDLINNTGESHESK